MENTVNQKKKHRKILEHWQGLALLLIIYDVVAIHTAYFLALWGRFDFTFSRIPDYYFTPYKKFITLYSVICVIVFWFFSLYKSMWRFAIYTELLRTFEASVLMSIFHAVTIRVFFG